MGKLRLNGLFWVLWYPRLSRQCNLLNVNSKTTIVSFVYVRFPASSSVFTFVYLSWLSCGAGTFVASSTIKYKYLEFQSHINGNKSGGKTKWKHF